MVRDQRPAVVHRVVPDVLLLPTKANRQVDDSSGPQPYQGAEAVSWTAHGKRIKITGLPKEHTGHLFRVVVSPHRTDYVVTNDRSQASTEATHEACGFRWKMEQLHRAGTQVTGLARCQCRMACMQHNPIGCAVLMWVRPKALAAHLCRMVYQLKHDLLDEYLVQQLRTPSLRMVLA